MYQPFLSNPPDAAQCQTPNSEQRVFHIVRRDIESGWIDIGEAHDSTIPDDLDRRWKENQPICLSGFLSSSLTAFQDHILRSEKLYRAILSGEEIETLLDQPIYTRHFGSRFELLSTRFDESDPQELVSVDFDVMENGKLLMEDIWMRIAWLSFLEADESLRFRFSFGMEGFDDVSLDFERQLAAAELCACVFPESALISANTALTNLLKMIVNANEVHYVERIVYYNACNGGAQFHHDAENGHLGVVYAQLSGETFWLALSRQTLIDEIQLFLKDGKNKQELQGIVKAKAGYENLVNASRDNVLLGSMLDDPGNDEISQLLNESSRFFAQLVNHHHAYVVKAGDVMLLPQQSMQDCAWHSVFCLGETAGQALSFAIK